MYLCILNLYLYRCQDPFRGERQVGIINIMSAICCTFMLQGDPSMKRRVSTQEGMLSEEEVQAASKLQAILPLNEKCFFLKLF